MQQETAQDLLSLLASTKGALTAPGGGGALNSVNFSTAMHRVGKYLSYFNHNQREGNDRTRILADPRFALFVCSAAEALVGDLDIRDAANEPLFFGSREISNMAWAVAKLKIAPPQRVVPVDISENSLTLLKQKSGEVRSMVYKVAKERSESNSSAQKSPWIPALSELCGTMLDAISYLSMQVEPNFFRLQEWSNMLWALSTAQRGDEKLFSFVISNMLHSMENYRVEAVKDGLRPQEWSNTIWALATAGIFGPEETLLPFVADLMDSNPHFVDEFKPQELSNTAWGIATILSKRPGSSDGPGAEDCSSCCSST